MKDLTISEATSIEKNTRGLSLKERLRLTLRESSMQAESCNLTTLEFLKKTHIVVNNLFTAMNRDLLTHVVSLTININIHLKTTATTQTCNLYILIMK